MLPVINIKAAVNAAQNNKRSRDGLALPVSSGIIRCAVISDTIERCPAGTGLQISATGTALVQHSFSRKAGEPLDSLRGRPSASIRSLIRNAATC